MQTVTKSNFVSIIRLSKKPHRIGTGQKGSEGGQISQLPAFPYGENYCVIFFLKIMGLPYRGPLFSSQHHMAHNHADLVTGDPMASSDL